MEAMRCFSTDPSTFSNLLSVLSSDDAPASVVKQAEESRLDVSTFFAGFRHSIEEWSQTPMATALTVPAAAAPAAPAASAASAPVEVEPEPAAPPVPAPAPEPIIAEEIAEAPAPVSEPVIDPDVQACWTWQEVAQHLVDREGSALAVAKSLGVTHPAVLGWVRGAKPQRKQQLAIARAVGRPIEFFAVSPREIVARLSARLSAAEDLLQRSVELVSLGLDKTDSASAREWLDGVVGYLSGSDVAASK